MTSFQNTTKRGPSSNGKYTTSELENVTLDDGTRIVTSPVTDIKRPVCAGIDVHKSVLMAAICVTNKETLSGARGASAVPHAVSASKAIHHRLFNFFIIYMFFFNFPQR